MSEARGAFRGAFFSYGFRPFFLAAGLYAPIALLRWLGALLGWWALPSAVSPIWWHAHEMIFGFALAAVCGFLLTAVPNWTSTQPVTGGPLALLLALWLVGRAGMWLSAWLPGGLVAALDLLLIPALLGCVLPPIHRSRSPRHYVFALFLVLLWVADWLSLLSGGERWPARTTTGLYLGTYVLTAMVAIIGGRVVPNFTRGALRARGEEAGVRTSEPIARAALLALVASLAIDLFARNRAASPALELANGCLALLAALLLALRARGWRFRETWSDPLLCVLHVGQAWLIVAFAARALASLTGWIPASAAFHALGAGAISTMILAFLTRAPLGHTGRPLRASPVTAIAYGLVVVGGAARVVAPLLPARLQLAGLVAAGALSALAFAVYSVEYFPILTRPRVA
ncbi:MAG TPA: NnrS family protein [Myxococcota bacterium]|nr:NnrS family protein [Myxococcota bacterium]